MAIAVTRLAGAQRAGAASHAITLPATANVGDLIILVIAIKTGSSNSITSVTGLGATWSKVVAGFATGSNSRVEIWRGQVLTAGTAITITPSASLAITWDAFQITGHDTTTPIQANSTEGSASGDATSDTTYLLGSPNPTNAANVAIIGASVAATASVTYSALTSGWTQGMAFTGSTTLHPAYSAYRTNMPTGAAAAQVTGSRAATNGYAWVVINEAAVSTTPVAADDTQALTQSETTAIASTLADTQAITQSETGVVAAQASGADTQAIASSEAANIVSSATLADTQAVASSDSQSIAEIIPKQADDTQGIASSDSGTVAASQTIADTQGIASTDTASAPSSRTVTDTQAIASSDSTSIAAIEPKAGSETQALASSETATTATSQTIPDTQGIASTDAPSIAATRTIADTQAIASSDAQSVAQIVPKSASDTQGIASTDTRSLAVATGVNDAQGLSILDAIFLDRGADDVPAPDITALASTDGVAITVLQSVADTQPLHVIDLTYWEPFLGTMQITADDLSSLSGSEIVTLFSELNLIDAQVLRGSHRIVIIDNAVPGGPPMVGSGSGINLSRGASAAQLAVSAGSASLGAMGIGYTATNVDSGGDL